MCSWGERVINVSFFHLLWHPQRVLIRNHDFSEVKNVSYLEVGIARRFLSSQSNTVSSCDPAGELQFGGCFPIDYFFHSVSANQPNNFNRPVQKSKERNILAGFAKMAQVCKVSSHKRKQTQNAMFRVYLTGDCSMWT